MPNQPDRAVLMLDIDGVLNPDKMRNPTKSGLNGYHKVDVREHGIRIWVTKHHGRLLTTLDADIVWATTWVAHPDALAFAADQYGIPTGLPEIFYDVTNDRDQTNTGKLDGVRSWLEDNNRTDAPLVWVDDDLGDKDAGWAEDRTAPTLLIKPIPQRGLTADHYQQISGFLDIRSL